MKTQYDIFTEAGNPIAFGLELDNAAQFCAFLIEELNMAGLQVRGDVRALNLIIARLNPSATVSLFQERSTAYAH